MIRKYSWLKMLIALAASAALYQVSGCNLGGGGTYDDGCIGPDGYNWCVAGGGYGEIHEPTVSSWDFTD